MKPTDDEQTIKQAYKKSALRYHPDKCKDLTEEEATAKFQSVANALKVPIAPNNPRPSRLYRKLMMAHCPRIIRSSSGIGPSALTGTMTMTIYRRTFRSV